jgi:hypothetical protein
MIKYFSFPTCKDKELGDALFLFSFVTGPLQPKNKGAINQPYTLLLTGCTFKVRDGFSIISIHATARAKPNISFRIF